MASKTVSSPRGDAQPTRGQTTQSSKKNDIWADNIHLRQKHEDPSIKDRLTHHQQLLNDSDKYVDYIKHVENQKL